MTTRCNGKNKNNQRCKRKLGANCTTKYCFIHDNINECNKQNITIDCPICMELIDKINDTELDCKHPICIDCAKKLYDNKCPICRAELSSKKLKHEDIKIIQERKQQETDNTNQELLHEFLTNEYITTANIRSNIIQSNNLSSLSFNIQLNNRLNMTLISI